MGEFGPGEGHDGDARALLRLVLADAVGELRGWLQGQVVLGASACPEAPSDWDTAAQYFGQGVGGGHGEAGRGSAAVAASPVAKSSPPVSPVAAEPAVRPSVLQSFRALAEVETKAPASNTLALRAEPLSEIRAALGECERCKLHLGRKKIVFGEGAANARLLFIGEGPGAEEDRQGRPFVGAAGQLLEKIIQAMGLRREEVYIANVVKCRPPNNRDPEEDEVAACEPFVRRQIQAVGPEVIVSLGRVALHALFRSREPLTRVRGRWRDYGGIALMPTLHPAYLLRNPEAKALVWADMQAVMQRLGLSR